MSDEGNVQPSDEEIQDDIIESLPYRGKWIAERNGERLTVHNVLASASLGNVKLDLDQICVGFGNSYYNPEEFPAARIDVRTKSKSVYTISLFESGRIQSTGGCHPMEAKKSMKKIAKKLEQKLGYRDICFQKFEVQNVLAVVDIGHPISLGHLIKNYPGGADYEPERFPAARIRVPIRRKAETAQITDDIGSSDFIDRRSKARIKETTKEETVTVNVFSTGKITFTGGKSLDSIHHVLKQLRPYFSSSKLGGPTSTVLSCYAALNGALGANPQWDETELDVLSDG